MIPLFLIWVYLLWVLILFGAELVRSLETFRVQDAAAELPDLLVLTVILWQCWRRQQKGLSLVDGSLNATGLNSEQWRRLRNLLLERHILEKTAKGRYVMIRDLAAIRLADMNSWLGQEFCGVEQSTSEKLRKLHPWIDSYERLMQENRQAIEWNMTLNLQTLFASQFSSADTGHR